ncbi:hypothetical protein J2Z66_003977 [Paenibacillus eucommiae]|uniref:Uncharacterized protein n=1 Tax=Paenibacillus eucommiae TaxID=1355755 RepID=A0ABS4J0T3_9BACL|nr:hypothetical protein [Paenibacillus eucommiae]
MKNMKNIVKVAYSFCSSSPVPLAARKSPPIKRETLLVVSLSPGVLCSTLATERNGGGWKSVRVRI